jgi:hypothetical protein
MRCMEPSKYITIDSNYSRLEKNEQTPGKFSEVRVAGDSGLQQLFG